MDNIDRSINAELFATFLFGTTVRDYARETRRNELEIVREIADGRLTLLQAMSEIRRDHPAVAESVASHETDLRATERSIAKRIASYLDYMDDQRKKIEP